MSTNLLKKPRFRRIIFTILIFLCILPILYVGVYRPFDYYLCRSLISLRLGMGFSPYTLEGYVQDSLSPGMTREDVVSTLEEIGRVKTVSLGNIDDVWVDQNKLAICTDPFNRIIILTSYSANGKLVSIKMVDD